MIALRPGIDIGYDDVGTGLPVVFLHGFPHNRTLWAPQLGGLMSRARCIAPDLRGFGESQISGPYSMDRYADDVIEMLDALRVVHDVYGGAYGRPLPAGDRAAEQMMVWRGLALDATYSAKAFAAAIAPHHHREDPTLFWLTFDGRRFAGAPR